MKKRNTLQKKIILESARSFHGHPTADDVYLSIKEDHPGISRATVFRNLKSLSEDKILTKIEVPASADKYDSVVDGHHHGICKVCNNVFDLKFDPEVEIDLNKDEYKEKGIDGYLILFKGICETCKG